MILSKKDYLYYLKLDKKTMMINENLKRPRIFRDYEWKFMRLLRKLEYYKNSKKGFINRIITLILHSKFNIMSVKLGFTIPINVCGPGLGIFHYGTIIINDTAIIGKECHIHCHTNIASNVKIGNGVYIGPGAKILNNVTIADNIKIGANAVVTKSFLEPGITIVGAPAYKVEK